MTEQPTITRDRAAAARAARSLRSQQRATDRALDRLEALGWTCIPPVPDGVTTWQLDAAQEVADLIDGRTLVLGSDPNAAGWDVHAVDADGFRPGPGRVTLICHDRPTDPVTVEVVVRVVMGQVP